MVLLSKTGRTLLAYFREEQAKKGRTGCNCSDCIKDMDNAHIRFHKDGKDGEFLLSNEKELFDEFLQEYLKNVQKILPQSYRARQMKMGGKMKDLVFEFETRFLKEPFLKAIRKVKEVK